MSLRSAQLRVSVSLWIHMCSTLTLYQVCTPPPPPPALPPPPLPPPPGAPLSRWLQPRHRCLLEVFPQISSGTLRDVSVCWRLLWDAGKGGGATHSLVRNARVTVYVWMCGYTCYPADGSRNAGFSFWARRPEQLGVVDGNWVRVSTVSPHTHT